MNTDTAKPKGKYCSHCGTWLEPYIHGYLTDGSGNKRKPCYAIGHLCPALSKAATSPYSNIFGS